LGKPDHWPTEPVSPLLPAAPGVVEVWLAPTG
jgi:hypothetical protein